MGKRPRTKSALREVADRMGCEIVHVYRDQGSSGGKGRNGRPAFDALCKGAARREFDIVMAWSVDRLGRSLQDLVAFLTELHALKIDLYLHQQGVDTTTPGGKALFQMMGVFAEFERSIIQDRIHAGLARARAQGKRLGRPSILRASSGGVCDETHRRGWAGTERCANISPAPSPLGGLVTTGRVTRQKTKRRRTVKLPRRNAPMPVPATSDKEKI